jgi:tRNA-2-methylthio-N6-dimethylallyladenosine synthase
MSNYYVWTIGCQMNKAESQRIADYLENCGHQVTDSIQDADVVLLNTCVVRQSAENKVLGMLGYLKGMKAQDPGMSVIVTGCFVDSNIEQLKARFPYADLFFKPADFAELLNWIDSKPTSNHERIFPYKPSSTCVTAFVPIIQGCNNFCSYCIVPYRRGHERSRPINEVVCEVTGLVDSGVREVTLLGQNVNSYGHDLPSKASLGDLLTAMNNVDELYRVRFLTNHPKDMSQQLVQTVASLGKVCHHINLPLQAGNDDILKAMGRGYTTEQYRKLIESIREYIPDVALSTDVIVGFPNESEEQFKQTLHMLKEIRFDTVHVAAYSPRSGTTAAQRYDDNVPAETKRERLNKVEELQTSIAGEINSQLKGKAMEVLVEGKKSGKWYGRTKSNKLVFFENKEDCLGRQIDVTIVKTSPWALQA